MTDNLGNRWEGEGYENRSEEELYEQLLQDARFLRESLYQYGVSEHENLPELARRWLTELANLGLREPEPDRQTHFKQPNTDRPIIDTQEGKLHPVRVGDHLQVFWLNLDGPRTGHGYKNIEVLDEPLRTQTATIAFLTILEANPIDVEKLNEALSDVGPPLEHSINERWASAWWGLLGDEGAVWNEKIQLYRLRYVLALLRYYRPKFDELPHDEQLALISGASERINAFLLASRQLVAFLEYGSPGHDLRQAATNASRDVRAAVLKDVEGLGSIRIAERLGLPVSEKYRTKNEHKRVVKMIERGRKMLEEALTKDGWQKQIDAMKADAARYRELSPKEKALRTMVDNGVPVEEARRRLEETGRPHGGSLRRAFLLPGDPD